MRRGVSGKLSLVAAQAGFGKTTAMASWAAVRAPGSSRTANPFLRSVMPWRQAITTGRRF